MIDTRSFAHTGDSVPALENLPARLTVELTARVLGFQAHDIPVLVADKLLTPLGTPAPNAPKFFARVVVAQCADDTKWLHKATVCVSRYWKRKRCQADPELTASTAERS